MPRPPFAAIVIAGLLAVLIGVPVVARLASKRVDPSAGGGANAPSIVVVTPHVEQIRFEFGKAFSAWHQRVHGTPVSVDWRAPGGTTEIRKQLESQLQAAVAAGHFSTIPARTLKAPDRDKQIVPEAVINAEMTDLPDVIFGGGSFEHTAFKQGFIVEAMDPAKKTKERVRIRLTAAPTAGGFTQAMLDETFGENKVGVERIYDPDQHWFGVALSGFGIVYNRDLLRELNLPEPRGFADLGNPVLVGKVALSDPRQSGSVATLYDSILNKEGWTNGWKILREMGANARYFTASSTQPPLDVSQGECVVGVAIDFYGRGQSQAVLKAGQAASESRVGYVDPPGATYIDADPASIVNGSRHPELARRFIEFLLTDEAQALWQFAPKNTAESANNPTIQSGEVTLTLGPIENRLRRMPSRRSMYEKYLPHFTDQTNPFTIASSFPLRGWRDLMSPLMGSFCIDTRADLRPAWIALNAARADSSFPGQTLAEMERLFYAMPTQTFTTKDGKTITLDLNVEPSKDDFRAMSDALSRWRNADAGAEARIAYTRFFGENYRRIVRLYEQGTAAASAR